MKTTLFPAVLRRTAALVTLLAVTAAMLYAAPAKAAAEQATFAAGCFWSMEAIFKQIKGVQTVVPGYSGGKMKNPSYEQVETGTTGHAETVNITYDPSQVSYSTLLKVLLTVRDPTTVNRQGPDAGTQYRSVIFYRTPQQKETAEMMITKIGQSHLWHSPIVTKVEAFNGFYQAEAYHFDYYNKHPDEPYTSQVVAPEIAEFRAKFKPLLKK